MSTGTRLPGTPDPMHFWPVQPAHATHPHHEGPPGDVNDVP